MGSQSPQQPRCIGSHGAHGEPKVPGSSFPIGNGESKRGPRLAGHRPPSASGATSTGRGPRQGTPPLAWPAPCPRVRSSLGRRLLTELGRAIDDPENPPRQLVLTSTKPVFLPKMLLRAGKAPGQAQAHPGRVRALPQGRWPEGDRPCACRGPQGGLTAQGRREVLRLQARLPSGLVTRGQRCGGRGQRRGGRGSAAVGGAAPWPRPIPGGARPRGSCWAGAAGPAVRADQCALERPRYSPSVPMTPPSRSVGGERARAQAAGRLSALSPLQGV